jgi:hypothetical protein
MLKNERTRPRARDAEVSVDRYFEAVLSFRGGCADDYRADYYVCETAQVSPGYYLRRRQFQLSEWQYCSQSLSGQVQRRALESSVRRTRLLVVVPNVTQVESLPVLTVRRMELRLRRPRFHFPGVSGQDPTRILLR